MSTMTIEQKDEAKNITGRQQELPDDDIDVRRWVERIKSIAAVRRDRVEQIRQAIAEGRYDLDSRLEDLFDHLPQSLARDLAGQAAHEVQSSKRISNTAAQPGLSQETVSDDRFLALSA